MSTQYQLFFECEQARRYCAIAACFEENTPDFLARVESIIREPAPPCFTINTIGPYTRQGALSFLQVSTRVPLAVLERAMTDCEILGDTCVVASDDRKFAIHHIKE